MKKEFRSLIYVLALGVSMTALSLGGAAGCGSGSSGGGGTTGTVTETETNAAVNAAVTAAFEGFSTGSALTLAGSPSKSALIDGMKRAITYTATSSCSEGSLPSITGESFTLNGSDIFDNGEGTATYEMQEAGSTADLSADFSTFGGDVELDGTIYNVLLDGLMGVGVDLVDSENFSFDIGSQDLSVSVDDTDCDIQFNLGMDINISGSTITVSVAEGSCVTACGSGFSLSGSESFTAD